MAGPTMRDFYWGFLSTWIPQGDQDGPPPKVEQALTCETCGHECGEDCTNCSGMKVGESICSICSRGQS